MKSKFTEIDKLPPQAIEVEEAVIGALMLEPGAFNSVSGILTAESFYKNEHQIIFDTVKDLHSRKRKIDLLTVTQALKDRDLLNEVGGPMAVTQLTRRIVSAAHIQAHARIIAEKYYKRNTIQKATELIKLAFSDEDIDLIAAQWKESKNSLEDVFMVSDTGTHISDVLKTTIQQIEEDCQKVDSGGIPGITTGFKSLNYTTGGWRNTNLIVLAARPGVGKTSLHLHFALSAAKAGHWVNIFSLEMDKEDLTKILISTESGVNRSMIRDGRGLDQSDWIKINDGLSELEHLPIIFKDSAGLTTLQIESIVQVNRKKNRCDFVIIDYLQLIKSTDKRANREQQIAEISRTLKTIAMENNVPVMALSQLNRIKEDEEPGLINLRESGAIEQDADIVCFLYRPESSDWIKLLIAKHRRGRTAELNIYHDHQMTRFSENPFDENEIPHPDQRIEAIKPF